MAKKSRLPKSEVIRLAEDHLRTLADLLNYKCDLDGFVAEEIKVIQDKWAEQIAVAEENVAREHKALVKLMRANKGELFDGGDKVKVEGGILVYGCEDKLRLPKDAVAQIENQGWTEAIVIAKSVDREVVQTWPVEKLALIGAQKKPVESFDYEIADDPRK